MNNIKHGDIITLDNGDVVKVSLEIIKKKPTTLEVGKNYKLQYTGEFCHWYNGSGDISSSEMHHHVFQFIGFAEVPDGKRAIFMTITGRTSYLMMGIGNLRYLVEQVD